MSYTGDGCVNTIPKKIQRALDERGLKADGGYFTRMGPGPFPTGKPDTLFTAWMKGEVVQTFGYDAQQRAWVPYSDKGSTQ